MAKFTKAHYQFIAEVLGDSLGAYEIGSTNERAVNQLIGRMANRFESDNPLFNVASFYGAIDHRARSKRETLADDKSKAAHEAAWKRYLASTYASGQAPEEH